MLLDSWLGTFLLTHRSTVYATATVTVVPSKIPTYAVGPCSSGVSSYLSACSCVGAVATTVTAPTPVTTVTSTVTTTLGPSPTCSPYNHFQLKVSAPGTPDDGLFVTGTVVANGTGPGGYWVEFTNNQASAPFFSINGSGTVLLPPYIAYNGDPLYLSVSEKYLVIAAGSAFDTLVCSVNQGLGTLSCTDESDGALYFAVSHYFADQLVIETSVEAPDYPISLSLVCA